MSDDLAQKNADIIKLVIPSVQSSNSSRQKLGKMERRRTSLNSEELPLSIRPPWVLNKSDSLRQGAKVPK